MNGHSIINHVAVGDIIRRCSSRFGDKIAMIDQKDHRLTFEQLEQKCSQLAHALLHSGLKKAIPL